MTSRSSDASVGVGDHVEVEDPDDPLRTLTCHRGMVMAPVKPLLLGGEGDEPDREIEGMPGQDAGGLYDGGHTAGIVVGARSVNFRFARGRVVMAADDDDFLRVGLPSYFGDHVPGGDAADGERLEPGLQAERLENGPG